MRHLIVAGVLVILTTLAVGFLLSNIGLLPEQAATQAQDIDVMFTFYIWAIAFLFSLIVVFMIYSIVVFRRRKGETGDGHYTHGNTAIEILWTVIPLVVVIGLAFWGSQVLAEINRPANDALDVNVVAQQWSFRYEYPEQSVISTDLVLPVNRQVYLKMSSLDVIHSFWVPEFRVKQDILPTGEEFVRDLRINPNKIGEYKVRCAELCGEEHTNMLSDVKVVSEADFEAWVVEQRESVSDDPVIRGRTWAEQFGCLACHSVDGSDGVGPTWKGVCGTTETLEDGTTVEVTREYLFESIRNPAAKIVAGYPNVMLPSFSEGMTDEQVEDVIDYICSLQ